jgi:hypothetical protein
MPFLCWTSLRVEEQAVLSLRTVTMKCCTLFGKSVPTTASAAEESIDSTRNGTTEPIQLKLSKNPYDWRNETSPYGSALLPFHRQVGHEITQISNRQT